MSDLSPQSSARVEEFRQRVLGNEVWLDRLRATDGLRQFVDTCLMAAREFGIELSPDEIESALNAARREWIERWVQ